MGNIEKNDRMIWREARYQNADKNGRLIMNLRDLGHTMRFLYEGKGSQKRVLIMMEESGGHLTQSSLTKYLGIQPGSVSEVLAKLESAGAIVRKQNQKDHRTVDVVLTKQGQMFAREALDKRISRHEQMFACLQESEKEQLLALLEKVNTDWKVRYPGAYADNSRKKKCCDRREST